MNMMNINIMTAVKGIYIIIYIYFIFQPPRGLEPNLPRLWMTAVTVNDLQEGVVGGLAS